MFRGNASDAEIKMIEAFGGGYKPSEQERRDQQNFEEAVHIIEGTVFLAVIFGAVALASWGGREIYDSLAEAPVTTHSAEATVEP